MDGIFLLDKPQGLTSHTAMQAVKRLFGAKKAGHTGSLDPLATGMLPICLGEATKFSQYILGQDKTYIAEGELGVATTTGDGTGEPCEQGAPTSEKAQLEAALIQLKDSTQQIPPMYSALKYQGTPLYRLARKGQVIERAARTIHIHALSLLAFDGHRFTIHAHVSKGTYIRTLVEDIGRAVGSCAHLTALRRVSIAGFEEEKMFTLDSPTHSLGAKGCAMTGGILPISRAVSHLKPIHVSSTEKKLLFQGQQVSQDYPFETAQIVSLWDEASEFFGVGEYNPVEKLLRVKRLRRMYESDEN